MPRNISDIEEILAIIINWVRDHPDKVDHEI
jgi:hypothetical protein